MLDILNAIKLGTFNPDAPAPVRFHKALDLYLDWADTNRPKSARARHSLAVALKSGIGDVPLDEIAPFTVERYKKMRRETKAHNVDTKVGPATINREVAMLKHVAGLAASDALPGVTMDAAKAAAVRAVKMLREPPGRVRSLTPDEEGRLFAALTNGTIRTIAAVADLSGMRRTEVVTLRRESVDLHNREIVLTVTKSNRVRRIPINQALAAILDEQIRAMPEGRSYLFTRRNGKPCTPDAVTRAFHRAVVKAGVTDLRFHDLRHDFATKVRRRGHGIDVISELLGHADIATTRRYAHVEASLRRAAVADLEAPKAAPAPATVAEEKRGASAERRKGRR